jgi:hypothetical protein
MINLLQTDDQKNVQAVKEEGKNIAVQKKYSKTKKALRKMKKRENKQQKKRFIPSPTNIQYIVNAENDSIVVKGSINQIPTLDAKTYIRFKLSGQKDFLEFGYQAKVPIGKNNEFQFEVLQAALLDEDEIAIQAFNEKGQASEVITCQFRK